MTLVNPPPFNEWVQISPCDTGTPPAALAGVTMEQVAVLSQNTLANLLNFPDQQLLQIYVNGRAFFPVGTSPDFSVSGQTITWLSTIYGIDPGATVIAVYTWSAPPA
jgi:hypothetical protein